MNPNDIQATWDDSTSQEYDKTYAEPIIQKLAELTSSHAELLETVNSIDAQLKNLGFN